MRLVSVHPSLADDGSSRRVRGAVEAARLNSGAVPRTHFGSLCVNLGHFEQVRWALARGVTATDGEYALVNEPWCVLRALIYYVIIIPEALRSIVPGPIT
eukprot:110884-Prorocentrum_minimum.AAC.1